MSRGGQLLSAVVGDSPAQDRSDGGKQRRQSDDPAHLQCRWTQIERRLGPCNLHGCGNDLELRVQSSKKHSPERPKAGGGARRTGPRNPWLVFSSTALVALLVYLPTLKYGFVWDDNELIPGNPFLARTNPIELFAKGFWNNPEVELSQDDATYYRPLANLSLYVDRKVWGLRPTGYHLTNVIVNSAVAFLMCLLLWELFDSVWLAALGGLLVGIHPAMNCVVTFISNRTYLLALFFLLVSAYALARGQRGRSRIWPVLFGGSLLLSSLALEATLVFAALAAAWVLANRARYRRLFAWFTAITAPLLIYFLLRFGVAHVPFASSFMRWTVTKPLRVINAFGQQLQLLLFPFNQKVIYDAVRPLVGFSAYTVLGLLFLGLPLYAVTRLGRKELRTKDGGRKTEDRRTRSLLPARERARLGWLGYAWMVLFLLPFAHLVVLGPAGRALYPAAPGVLILLAALFLAPNHKRVLSFAQVDRLRHPHPSLPLKGEGIEGRGSGVVLPMRSSKTTRVVYGAILLYTALFAVQTLRRNPIWHDGISLSEAMVREAPGVVGGHMNYGLALADAGRKQEAIKQFHMAARMDPDFVLPHLSLAFALIDEGALPGAIRELREVVRLQPESPRARNDLAMTLLRSGQFDSAVAEYKVALRLDPNSEQTLNNLGYAYLESGDVGQAISFLEAALRIKPDFAGARRNLADAYRKAGMPDSATLIEGSR
jgi:protein O-mannosyl-transferase